MNEISRIHLTWAGLGSAVVEQVTHYLRFKASNPSLHYRMNEISRVHLIWAGWDNTVVEQVTHYLRFKASNPTTASPNE
jgi:hypothetical protein